MSETYCGKNCEECSFKEEMNCPGCKDGPGLTYTEKCTIAKCCREKERDTCFECKSQSSCGLFTTRIHQPEYIKEKLEAEKAKNERIFRKAKILAKWVFVLFWISIFSEIISFIESGIFKSEWELLMVIGESIRIGCYALYGLILLRFTSIDKRFLKAGICYLITTVSIAISIIFLLFDIDSLFAIFFILGDIAIIFSIYYEFTGYSEATSDVNSDLSDRWHRLCKIVIWMSLLNITIPLGFLLSLFELASGGAIIYMGVHISKLVFLYKTAQAFKNCIS